ncbi:MAG TPA: TonB-dependent receptor plug domain-containing protein, partial [Candidatus Synoicihabitans sp.]|nr:TonB-dependent receptor plug domain-containing protein [Candidatus Synoicihabitans sp.]
MYFCVVTRSRDKVNAPAPSAAGRQGCWGAALCVAFSIGASLVQAQPSSAPVSLAPMLITGSRLPTTEAELAVPVTQITRAELERLGTDTSLLEVLQKRIPLFTGGGNLGPTNSNVNANNTIGGSSIALRNLSTLVLVDGRRVADNGANSRGGRSYVDVNQIPLAAIESIEVLSDGASALYGSDAVGGVVNVRLRRDFEGVEVGGRYGFSTADGDYEEKSAFVAMGARQDRLSVTVTGSMSEQTPLFQGDRPFSRPLVGRTATISGAVSAASTNFPQALLRADLGSPSQAVPVGTAATAANLAELVAQGIYTPGTFATIGSTFDIAPWVTLTLGAKKKAGTLAATYELIPERLELEVQGLYSESRTMSQLPAQPVALAVPANSPYNPTRSSLFAAFRMQPLPRVFHNQADLRRLVTVLRGRALDRWEWEIGYNHNDNRLANQIANVLYNPNLQLAIAGGYNAAGAKEAGGRYARVFRDYGAPPGLTTLAQYQAAITPENSQLQPALDIFARPEAVDPASLDGVLGVSSDRFRSTLRALDVGARGVDLLRLPGGGLSAALGAAWMEEGLAAEADQNNRSSGPTALRWAGTSYFNPFTQERTTKSAYAEVRLPFAGEGGFQAPGLAALEATA